MYNDGGVEEKSSTMILDKNKILIIIKHTNYEYTTTHHCKLVGNLKNRAQ